MKIIWLASWYPNKTNLYNGDFIKRHAIAVAGKLPLSVIYVVKDQQGTITNDVRIEETKQNGLHEIIA